MVVTCPACKGTGERWLPVHDDVEPYPCPVCQPWRNGFPGESVSRGGRTIWIISPAEPGEPAVWRGWPKPCDTPGVEQ